MWRPAKEVHAGVRVLLLQVLQTAGLKLQLERPVEQEQSFVERWLDTSECVHRRSPAPPAPLHPFIRGELCVLCPV